MIPAFVAIVAIPEKVLSYAPVEPAFALLNIQNAQDLLLVGSAALVLMFLLKSVYIIFFAYVESRFLHNRKS